MGPDYDGDFVNQSRFEIHLPGLASRWEWQQETCLGPDRPTSQTSGARSKMAKPDRANRHEVIEESASAAFLNFIHGGLKQTSSGPMPALMTYALKTDVDGNGMLVMAEEGDHTTVDSTIPQLRKYDGREVTKHKHLASGGNLLFAGQIFVDLGSEWEMGKYSWSDIEKKGIDELFPNAAIVIDDGSGTFTPPAILLPTLACVIQGFFPGIRVVPMHYLETAESPAAQAMGLSFDTGNVVKWHQQRGFDQLEKRFLYPYTLKVEVVDGTAEINVKSSKFPSSWSPLGEIKSGTANAEASRFTLVSEIATVEGKREGSTITWMMDGKPLSTWKIGDQSSWQREEKTSITIIGDVLP